MIRGFLLFLLAGFCALAQKADPAGEEEAALSRAMGEAGSSQLEMIRALERHLAKYPDSTRRGEIERALAKASIEARDQDRILKYGEKHLAVEPRDLLVLERVTRILTTRTDKASNERGLEYARRFEQGLRELEKEKPAGGRINAQLREDLDRGLARARTFQARAQGNLGRHAEAVELATMAFAAHAGAEPAREIARWLIQQRRFADALPHLADAFAIPDARLAEDDRRAISKQLGELYTKLHASEQGLGDLMLGAYDRVARLLEERQARLRQLDPNAGLSDPMQFTLSGVNDDNLDLKTLRGKVVVLDFWATWCGPCRAQYPMYERVRERFQKSGDVVFLGINTDENRDLVKPFLEETNWNK
ncbi:MAG: TlpA family protein disulfide reductase, partial [Acidobacteria bacterium]|nr:TlpA family protein disulfide reductase [Acidobacteriota bacterium]